MSILYRMRQFWRLALSKTDQQELRQVQACLSRKQWELFIQLQPGEQNHAVMMFHKLQAQGENQPDLLVAALLHDIGKVRYRLNPFDRAIIVLVKAAAPALAHRWGSLPADRWDALPPWRKAFIVSEQHAEWGAEMGRQVEVSPLVETLIRLHHQPEALKVGDPAGDLLHKLWLVDNQS